MNVEAHIKWNTDTFTAALAGGELVYIRKNNIQVGIGKWKRKKLEIVEGDLPVPILKSLSVKLKVAFLGKRVKASMFKAPKPSVSDAMKYLTLPDIPDGCVRAVRVKGAHYYSAFLMPEGELIVCRNSNIAGKGLWEDGKITTYTGSKVPTAVLSKITSELNKP